MSIYFDLDLDIPSPPSNQQKRVQNTTTLSLPKFELVQKLSDCHGFDVKENNKWFQPALTRKNFKSVRFKPTEIYGRDKTLPSCHDRSNHDITLGNLHAPDCPNSKAESHLVLGEHAFMNRIFLITSRYCNEIQDEHCTKSNHDVMLDLTGKNTCVTHVI